MSEALRSKLASATARHKGPGQVMTMAFEQQPTLAGRTGSKQTNNGRAICTHHMMVMVHLQAPFAVHIHRAHRPQGHKGPNLQGTHSTGLGTLSQSLWVHAQFLGQGL